MGSERITIAGANMWDLLGDEEPGHSTTVVDNLNHSRKVAAAAAAAAAAAVAANIVKVKEAPLADKYVPSGTGGAKPAKRAKKTKTATKKKGTTVDNGDVRINVNGQEGKKTPPPSELEEEMSEDEGGMTGDVATRGSRCRTVAWRMFRAAGVVALLALYCQLASPPPSDA